ncbi:T-complex [Trema orientale]|uniref:T-complex n=1 Tax=Trema orientale TaxID=63057 RepID=A0A2P5G2E2_TREOI|nr:T-complex [Trema orientale]
MGGGGGGVESEAVAIAMEFPASETASSYRIPRRLSRRLLVHCKTPCTVEQIEAKLHLADLRRQQYYEQLSTKARPKPRSPSRSSSYEEDLAQRLEAKLQAAAQKRSSIIAKAQMRLARLDELRQAAKNEVEMRYEKEREKLGSKVQLRVQQAEANRMLMLKAYRQRRATLKERSSQSLLRKMARENKYKERVRAAIHQKRAAAEKKRLGLLEAEKKRACARMLQVHRVARSVSHQREIERRRMMDQLEDRLQRARRQRAEYLRHRGRLHNSVQVDWKRMHRQADLLSRKLARCWRRFLRQKTTLALVKAYDTLNINEKCVKSMPFDQLAVLIGSPDTLHAVKALLDRFESRLKVSRAVASANHTAGLENIDHLLKRVASPKKRTTPRTALRGRDTKKAATSRETARNPAKLSRYQVRVALCAYMILSHPEAVFSSQGEREIALAKAAEEFVREFELLLKIILEGPVQSSDEESDSMIPKRWTFKSQLATFDKAWCSYLNCFVIWKVKDAQLLEEDLVRAACQLELSMMQKCKMTPEGDSSDLTHDLKAIQKQVTEDQKLLKEKVQHLSGDAGIERMECALSEARSKYFLAKENGNPSGPQITHFISPSPSSSTASLSVARSDKRSHVVENIAQPSRVVRSLFREDNSPEGSSSSAPRTIVDGQLGSSVAKLVMENELIVNEFLHKQQDAFTDIFNLTDEDQNGVKAKIRETMENAFWDSIMESMKSDNPNYDRIVQLMREMKDELCQMAPESWRQMIVEAIDLDILSQVLKSGNLDIHYLGNILEFALDTLQKLSSPSNDGEMKTTHQRLMKELACICEARGGSSVIAMIKGLRFVLEQIQVLKREISKARIRLMEPLLKGPAGLDYLRNAFANRHGSPSDAYSSLPRAVQWLSSVRNCKDQEWEEHMNSLSALDHESLSHGLIPSTTLRSGGSFVVKPNLASLTPGTNTTTGNQQLECKGEKVDLLVRLGLLKLVSGVSGLTREALPETFILNLSRLRAVQAQIQKIIVTAISILICRQTLLSERIIDGPKAMEGIMSECSERLVELLDHVEDAGIEEIVESISRFSPEGNVDSQKLQSRKVVMARMLAKSLQAGDPVFERVSCAVYRAARGVVLGGSQPNGRKLAETALRQVGAAVLSKKLVEAAEVLVVAATVSVSVHGPWYTTLTDNM